MNISEKIDRARNKIFEIEEVAQILESVRNKNQKIVHCHGVFDLLHIGHIRHLENAKKFGDVLIVTVTPDRFVNKGPHRPAFPENLRAEAVAALSCVDYVAINKWPVAVETIRLLRPDFYVKGQDYRSKQKDRTGGILLEEEAIRSVGGQIVFTDEISFSSSKLINEHIPVFPKEVTEYLSRFSERHSLDDILSYIDRFRALKVLVVGEAIIDEYQYCEAIGKSSKEPMLAVKRLSTERFAGGILAAGNHVANFCDRVSLLTMLGDRHTEEDFIFEKLNKKIERVFLYRKDSPTIVKRRFVDHYFFTKMMELYEINDASLQPSDQKALCDALSGQIPKFDAVLVIDFGHGMFNQESVDILCKKASFLAVNAQSNAGNVGYQSIMKYRRANYICMAEHEIRMEARDRRGDLKKMVLDLSKKIDCERITVTRGSNGCLCYSREEGFFEVPAFAGQVMDRMGAGDAFLSLTALCVAKKVPTEVVGFIGNVVGAEAVATIGHRKSIEQVPLLKHIESILK